MFKIVAILLCLSVYTNCYHHHSHHDEHDEHDHDEQQKSHEDQHDYDYHIGRYYDGDHEAPVIKVPIEPLPLLPIRPKQLTRKPKQEEEEEEKVSELVRANEKPNVENDKNKGQLFDLKNLKAFTDQKIKELKEKADISPPKRVYPEPLPPLIKRIIPYAKINKNVKEN